MKTEDSENSEGFVRTPHDTAFKKAFQNKETARQFFQRFLPEEFNRHIDYERMAIENRSYVDDRFREKHSDIIYTARIRGKPGFLYILFEHQSAPDYWMSFRLLCYMINIWNGYLDQNKNAKQLPVIIPLVLYHGKTAWHASTKFQELIPDSEAFSAFLPRFEYRLINCADYDNDALVDMCGDLTLSVVLFMMKNIFQDDFEPVFKELTDLFIKLKTHPDILTWFEWALKYAYHARNESEEKLKNVIESNIIRINDNKIMEVAMSVAEQIEQRGLKIGIERGVRQERSSLLLKQLKIRFRDIPPHIENKVREADLDVLEGLVEAIFDFKTIEDVEKRLG